MEFIWSFAKYWAGFLLIGFAQLGILSAARSLYHWMKVRLDRRIPDDLPLMTGEWVTKQIARITPRHRIRVLVTGQAKAPDCYWPSRRVIHLTEETYFKRDPAYWAVGAHELSHAIIRQANIIVDVFFSLCRIGSSLTNIAFVLLLANILYNDPLVTQVAWWVLIVGLCTKVGVLVEEALASGMAVRQLRRDDRIGSEGLSAARKRLFFAWLTYLADFGGSLLLLVMWRYMIALLANATPAQAAGPLSGFGAFVATTLAILLLIRSVWFVFRTLVPHDPTKEEGVSLDVEQVLENVQAQLGKKKAAGALWLVALAVFLLLVWDVSVESPHSFVVALSFVAVMPLLNGLAGLVFGIALIPLFLLIYFAVSKFVDFGESKGDKKDDMTEYDRRILSRDIAKGKGAVEDGELAMALVQFDALVKPELVIRLHDLQHVLYVPLALVYLFS